MNERLKQIKLHPVRYYKSLIKNDPQGIDLTIGEGHFNSPFNAKLKVYEALLTNNTKYSQIEGDKALRKLVVEKYYPKYDENTEIIITNGSSQGLFNVLLTLISSFEDEVIIAGPYYPAYYNVIRLLGAKPVVIDTSKSQFKLNRELLEIKVNKNTKALIINEPNNPTGVSYTLSEKKELLNYSVEKEIYVIVDEIYRLYTDSSYVPFHDLLDNNSKKYFIFINGLSKSHLMTGYRIGFVLSNPLFCQQLRKANYLIVSSISSIMQQAAIGALTDDYFCEFVKKYYLNNVAMLLDALKFLKVPYVDTTCGYYVFIDVSKFNMSGREFCLFFSKNYHIALVPGDLFGVDYSNYIRVSCCKDVTDIVKFVEFITSYIASISQISWL